MKKLLLLLIFFVFALGLNAQTLVATYPFPYFNSYNYFWGITQRNDTLWIGSDFDGTGYPFSMLYKVTKTGTILDSFATPFKFNHGLEWDGSNFWIAEDYKSNGAKIYKISPSGVLLDSIMTGTWAGGIGDIALDGDNLWFSVYYPDYTTYPYAYAYKVNLSTKQIIDTIPLRGRQVYGIAVKGDTIFYVNDNLHSEQERIYAYRKAIGDTLFSFAAPDPDNDCDPHGLYWDGQHLWLIAFRVGGSASAYRCLYKYEILGQGSPTITTSTSSINFGDVIIGNTGIQNLTINNVGTAKLIISAKTITNPVFGIIPSNVPDTINPGSWKDYNITFTPTAFDTTLGQLQISSNDMATPVKTINLRGRGVYSSAVINLSAASFNYNDRRVNSLCGFQFQITNQGTSPLTISSASFTTPRYKFDTNGVTFPIVIEPQISKQYRVWFNPNTVGPFIDTLSIVSNASNLPTAKISFTGNGVSSPAVLGDIMWQGTVPDNPYTSYDDYQPKSMKEIPDVNGDGVNDLIICSGNYLTHCWNGNSSVSADIIWIFNTGYNNNNTGSVDWEDAMQIRTDVDGDGISDVVIGCAGGNEMVYTISGRTGRLIWFYGDSVNYATGDIMGIRTDKDYNNDGVNDVLVSASGTTTGGRHSVICLNGLNGTEIFNVVQAWPFTYDISNSPYGGAIGLTNNGTPYTLAGFNNSGANTWNYSLTGALWSIRQIPDINNNSTDDFIGYQGFSGSVFTVDASNGGAIWNISLGSGNNGTILILSDLDSNGFPDFTLSGPQIASRVDTKTNTILWQNAFAASYIRDIADVGDINGDSINDIAFSTQTPGRVYILNGVNGYQLFMYEFGSTVTYRADRVEGINSIDGNQTKEFVGGCRDGRIICFSGGPNPVGISKITQIVPDKYELHQNYPNPFNPVTNIKFDLPKNSTVSLKIYDINGREINEIVKGHLNAGQYEYEFNANGLSSGVYFYKLTADNFSHVKKMILLK